MNNFKEQQRSNNRKLFVVLSLKEDEQFHVFVQLKKGVGIFLTVENVLLLKELFVRLMEGIPRQLDSGFHAVDSGFQVLCRWNLDSGFQSLISFRIP